MMAQVKRESGQLGLAIPPSIMLRADQVIEQWRPPMHGLNGGVADSLVEAKAAFRAAEGGTLDHGSSHE
jgi:hypothetical protein